MRACKSVILRGLRVRRGIAIFCALILNGLQREAEWEGGCPSEPDSGFGLAPESFLTL
jgi:hypothetical protein